MTTISLPLATNAMTHPTNTDAINSAINTPSVAPNMYASKWPDQYARYLSVTTDSTFSGNLETNLSSKNPTTMP